ncbi:cytochrome P450 [Podospora didyma]|uniref:Cytochrome P450 monooxygenase ABA1 n=1 Tax=Podospora didyma TaxID=330526 RepID=A0AAE0U951_9PEZI|nr:cytochrome P450 [Podospora didyma]
MLPELLAGLLHGTYLVPALSLGLVVYIVVSYVSSWSRLRHIPGPPLASWSYLWMLRICFSGKQAERYKGVNAQYGSRLVRIGPNDLITDDPDIIRRMNAARSPYRKSSWYYAMKLDPYEDSLFSLTDTAAHEKLRAKLAFGYGAKENSSLETDIDEQLVSLIGLIRSKYISSDADGTLRRFDLATAAQFFTLDTLTKIAYGTEFGYLSRNEDVYGYIQTAEESVPFLVMLAEMPFLGRVFLAPWVLKLVGPKKTDKRGVGVIMDVAEKVVNSRFEDLALGREDQKDMLGSFIRHGVTKQQCQIEVPFQMIAGSDTTATAIRATLLHLTTNRRAYDRLQREIDDAAADGRVSSPVKAEEGKHLEYLQAVIYEGLRMNVPFSGLLMKEVPAEGDTLNGVHIPGGTRIAHNTMGVQRSKDIFGDDVDVFRPERWLTTDAAHHYRMQQTTDLVFGYGRWGCLGKPVAWLELNKIFVELLRRFDFQLINPKEPWHEANHNMFFQSKLWMRVTERCPENPL